jgi:membrane-bound lytic murein transglycosylase D
MAFGPDMPGWGGSPPDAKDGPSKIPDGDAAHKSVAAMARASADSVSGDSLVGPGRLLDPPRAERNARVDKWIDFFTGPGRDQFQRWLLRSGDYMDMLHRTLRAEGAPEELANLVFVESGFNMKARSVARAVGPWQFIRGTAKLFGLKIDPYVDERRDPEASTRAAARYLKRLYGMFDGSWPLALAAYNSGEGTVQRAIRRQGTKDFWSLDLPTETEEYVPQFLAAMEIASDPGRYGFDLPPSSSLAFDEVVVSGPVDLGLIAKITVIPMDQLQSLNPSFVRQRLPAHLDGTALRVPHGRGGEVQSTLDLQYHPKPLTKAEIRAAKVAHRKDLMRSARHRRHNGSTHVVRRGETLNQIATRYGLRVSRLKSINGIESARDLRAGQRLRIR